MSRTDISMPSMKALHKLQQAFAADLWGDDLQHLQGLILDDQISAARRFNVYRNNFQSSLIDALAAIYPVVEQLVGLEFFGFMTDRYIRAHPSRSGNLHNLGNEMASFLRSFQPASTLPYLSDVARLEWAYHQVFHAPAARPFEPEVLEQMSTEEYPDLCFNLGPACRLVCSAFPIFGIWQVNQENYIGDKSVNLTSGPESVLIVRPEMEVELWRLDPAECCLLVALENGSNLGEAVETTLGHSGEYNLQASLAKYLSSGALIVSKNPARQPKKVSDQAKSQLTRSTAAMAK